MRYLQQRLVPALQPIHYLIFTLSGLVILDGLMTHFIVGGGMAQEANPLMAPLVGGNGFLLIKVLGALVCATILMDVYKRRAKLAILSTSAMVVCYLAIVCWNSYVLLTTV